MVKSRCLMRPDATSSWFGSSISCVWHDYDSHRHKMCGWLQEGSKIRWAWNSNRERPWRSGLKSELWVTLTCCGPSWEPGRWLMEGGATPEKHEAHSTQLSTNMLFPCLLAEFSSKRWEFVYTFGQSNHQSAADLDVIHTTHTHTHPRGLSWNTPCWLWLSPSHAGSCKTEAASALKNKPGNSKLTAASWSNTQKRQQIGDSVPHHQTL